MNRQSRRIPAVSGVTLVELLVAMTIFAIVLVGIVPLSIYVIDHNRESNRVMKARNIMANTTELLKMLPRNDPWRFDPDGPGDLEDNLNGDHNIVPPYEGIFGVRWNIATNPDNSQDIRIFINWLNGTRQRSISSTFTLL